MMWMGIKMLCTSLTLALSLLGLACSSSASVPAPTNSTTTQGTPSLQPTPTAAEGEIPAEIDPGEEMSLPGSNDIVLNPDLTRELTAQPGATVTEGVFQIRQCQPDKMAPGYTLTYPLEGYTIYWFQGCELVHLMDVPGNVNVAKQTDEGIYALIKSGLYAYDQGGTLRFAVRPRDGIPGPAHHDVIQTPRDTYLTLTKVEVAPQVYDDVIIEADPQGNILWQWSTSEHLLGATDGASSLEGAEQWIHSNSLDLFPNGDILLSARNLDQIVRIGYPNGEVVWRRGEDVLGLQHHATVQDDGSILVYNNGVGQGEETRITRFGPDGAVLDNRPLGFYSDAFGSVEELSNGNWLVVDGKAGRLLEYTPDLSEVVFEAVLLRGNYVPYSGNAIPVERFLYRATAVDAAP